MYHAEVTFLLVTSGNHNITALLPTSRRGDINGVFLAYVITECEVWEVGICDARVCILFLSSTLRIIFNPSDIESAS